MAHPTWLAYGFAAAMVVVSVYCIGRLVFASRFHRIIHRDVNIAHVLMGVAMTGMLVPRWSFGSPLLWELVFGVLAVWFLGSSIRFVHRHGLKGADQDHVHHLSHRLIHMVMSCAMLYMYWLGAPMSGPLPAMSMGSASGSAGDPGLTLLLMAVLIGSAVWQLDAITRFPAPGPVLAGVTALSDGASTEANAVAERVQDEAAQRLLAPRLEIGCHIVVCVATAYMLVLML